MINPEKNQLDISDKVNNMSPKLPVTIDKYLYDTPDMFTMQYERFLRDRNKLIRDTFEYLGYDWHWLLENRDRVRVIKLQGAGIDEYYFDGKHLFDIVTVSDVDYVSCTARIYSEVKVDEV